MKSKDNLDSCTCCEGISVKVPAVINNRPGLKNISYRIGNHSLFKQSLISRLTGSGQDSLKDLTTRENNDFTIALFDSWAVVADVLTFYQERIVNESFLGTSSERRSVLELARLLGYELKPGVAASVYIAFMLDDTPGAFTLSQNVTTADTIPPVTLDAGIKLQSIPGPGEQAQVFETAEKIEARPQWNSLKPRLFQPQTCSINDGLFYLEGITNHCEKGDVILINEGTNNHLRKIIEVITDPDIDTTCIKYEADAEVPVYKRPLNLPKGSMEEYMEKSKLDSKVVTGILSEEWDSDDLTALLKLKNWSEKELVEIVKKLQLSEGNSGDGVYIYRDRSNVFGYNATKLLTYYTSKKKTLKPQSQWKEWVLKETPGNIYTDGSNGKILPASYISIQNENIELQDANTYVLKNASVQSRTKYGMSANTTHLIFESNKDWWPSDEGKVVDKLSLIRNTNIYAQSEALKLSGIPIHNDIAGDEITLDGLYLGLKKGEKVIVSGEIKDPGGVVTNELMELKQISIVKGFTAVQFTNSLKNTYLRDTLVIYANVARATHGETVEEILGSGDARKKFQRFRLKHRPLTYTGASTPGGIKSSLEIRVNDVLWKSTETLYGYGPDERVYTSRIDNDGTTTVIFGDGTTGARLPGGQDNVRARYRKGIGLAGVLKKDQISQLMTKPLGVKSALNPMPSAGGADQENLINARRNATKDILTLDRLVSLKDYEDFTRAFAGIEKSLAIWSWNNGKRCIFITVAGPKGSIIKKESTVYTRLLKALRNSSNPNTPVSVESFRSRYFSLAANIKTNPVYEADKVIAGIEEKLRSEYSFDKREFGQPVTYSEIVSVIHTIRGVLAVDIDLLYLSDAKASINHELKSSLPVPGDEGTLSAELLTLDPRPIQLYVMV